MTPKGYHKLRIISDIKELIKLVYLITEKLPRSEEYGLKSQLRRAVISVLLNVVEGHRKSSNREFYRFLETADCSLTEVEVGFEIAVELKLVDKKQYLLVEEKRKEVAVKLVKFMQQVRNTIS